MRLISSLIFYPMLWLRGIFLTVGKWASGFCTLGFILGLGMNLLSLKHSMPWEGVVVMGGMAFIIFMLIEFYDQILLRLNPTDSELILFK